MVARLNPQFSPFFANSKLFDYGWRCMEGESGSPNAEY